MKYSGCQWIGYIPDYWEVKKVKQCFYISKEPANQKNPTVLCLARSGVKVRDISNNEGQLAVSYDNYNVVKPGDLLLNPMDLYSGANCNMSEIKGVISPAYVNLRAKEELNPKFFDYFFKTQYWTMAMFAHGKGVSFDNRWTMNADSILNYKLPYPSFKIQNKIVAFLLKETNVIDSVIDLEKKSIEQLKLLKQSLITKCILNCAKKDPILYDCNISWIGLIDEDNSIKPLKYLLYEPMQYGANESGALERKADSYRYIRITDINSDGSLKYDGDEQFLDYSIGKPYELEDGDVLFARSGGTVGKSFFFKNFKEKCAFAGYLIKAKCDKSKLLPEYLYLYTQSSIYELWKQQIFIQSTIQNIGANKYQNMPVVVPSIENQNRVVIQAKAISHGIEKLISKKEKKIEQLIIFKQSLIFEYITGKKEIIA